MPATDWTGATTKRQARAVARTLCSTLPVEQRAHKSAAIVQAIVRMQEFQQRTTLLAYVPVRSEVDILPLVDTALRSGKRVALPRCRADASLDFYWIPADVPVSSWQEALIDGPFGLREPPESWPKVTDGGPLIIVPALAYTAAGIRLGKGRGYYDRFLATCPPECFKVGVCFQALLAPMLPSTSHDMPVDAVVTEVQVYR